MVETFQIGDLKVDPGKRDLDGSDWRKPIMEN
jgi:hypothetical protein